MKKLKLLLPALLLSLFSFSQAGQINQIKIINFTVKNTLPATIDSWISTPGALVLIAQKVPNTRMTEPRLVVQIRSGGAVICGNNAGTARQIDPFDVRTFNTADLTGFLTACPELKEGTYTICVQFFNIDKVAISNEVCKDFRVEAANIEYAPPTLITPDNGKKFTTNELTGPVTFRWTPLVPKPKEPVTYRLKVWQLMQGQNGTMAMRTNQPIVTKDVDNITQATVSGIYTGPCRPPYLCDFIWQVQALNRSGKPMGNNNGNSEPYTFGIAEEKLTGPENTLPADKKEFTSGEASKPITFRWTPVVPKPQEPVTYRLRVWQLMQGQSGSTAMKTNPPIITRDVADITEASVSNIYTGPCRPPYLCNYIWEVQAVTRTGTTLGTSNPTEFNVKEGNITGPENTLPSDKKEFTSADAMKGVAFRWTPVVPKPQEPVTYRLRVWQLMQGETGSQAMRERKPIITRDVADITEASVSNIYTGPCRPPYLCNYIWEVQAVTRTGTTLGTSNPTEFSVKEGNITGPENTLPAGKKEFTSADAMKGVTFRWTPVVPKPQEPVTYRLRVWQLMQGQTGSQAMKTNPPIITRDVADITEASVSNIYTGPCRPPYLCNYIWEVQAVTRTGTTLGTSNPTEFNVKEGNITGPENTLPADKKEFTSADAMNGVTFRWTPVVPKPQEPVTYRMRVWQLMQGQSGSQAMKTNPPIITRDVADITEASVSNIYTGPCRPPYLCNYIWSVEASTRVAGAAPKIIGTSEATTFKVTEENIKCPANTFPEDKKSFSTEQARQAITFKWTKNETPGTSSSYRLKVWQLMQGQSGSQAMKTNKPIISRDMEITEATVSGIYTGPCRPPYLCDYVWAVEMRNTAGETTCISESTTFSVTEENTKCPSNLFPEDKKQFTYEEAKKEMIFRWTPLVPKPQQPVTYRLKVWQLMQGQSGSTAMRTNKPIVTKDVADITEASVGGIYTGPCRPPYLCDYVWTVEVRNAAGQTVCTSEPTTFSIKEETKNCPANLFPENNQKINIIEAKEAITFRWSPTLPVQSPAYRLKVWQLMQGQNAVSAMKSNKPLFEKMVRGTTEATINNLLTGPCKPPMICDFVWSVDAISTNGQTTCSSEASMFSVTSGGCTGTLKITSDSCVGVVNGMYKHRVCATYTADPSNTCNIFFNNPINNTTNNFGMLMSAQTAIFCSRTPGTSTSGYTLPLASQPSSLTPGASASFCFDLFVPLTATGVKFTAFGFCDDQTGNFNTANANDTIDVVPCICKECDKVKIEFPTPPTISESNNIISLTGGVIKASPKKVKRITADLVYFDMKADDNCWLCNKNSNTFGNFTGGTIQGNDFSTSMPGPHSVQWTNIGDADISGGRPFTLNISIPPTVACCDAEINFCIRYIIMFDDCTVCNVKVCYTYKKVGCQK